MNTFIRKLCLPLAAALLAGCATTSSMREIKLSGAQEVPPVTTTASGTVNIVVAADKSVSGSVKTTGIVATMSHIHIGVVGKNGPVIVPLTRNGDNGWAVPAGAKLTDAQYDSYKAGGLYVNVHSAAKPGGEIRAQLVAPQSTGSSGY